MVLHGPGFQGGLVPDGMVSLIDLPPTLLRAAGVEIPQTMRGHALQDLVDGTAPAWPDDVFIQISESHCGRAVRTRRWKYSVRAPDTPGHALHSSRYVEEFLYDTEADPHERNNLVGDPSLAGIRSLMKQRLLKHMLAAGEPLPEIRPAG